MNPDAPLQIRLASIVVWLEALGLLGLGIGVLVSVGGDRLVSGLTSAFFFALSAAGLGFCAWGLGRLHRWSRSPIVLAQLIQLGVSWSFYGDDTVWVAIVLAPIAVAVLAVMLSSTTTELLYGERIDPRDDETGP